MLPRLLVSLFFLSALPLAALEREGGQVVRSLQPKMRVVDRDWTYFKSIPCSQLDQLRFHSRSEELLLARRKSACLNRYKAFFSNPVSQNK